VAKKKLKVGFIPEKSLRQMCLSYSMVKAIYKSLKVINNETDFISFVRQNYVGQGFLPGGKAAVSAEIPNPAKLREIRDQIFHVEMAPLLRQARHDSPRVFADRLPKFIHDKNTMLVDIAYRYDQVQTRDKSISEQLLAGKRAMAWTAAVGGGLVTVIGAGYALVAIATVGMAAAGTATAAQAIAAAGAASHAGCVSLLYSLAHVGVSTARSMEELGDAHLLAVIKEKGGSKAAAAGADRLAESQVEHGIHLVGQRNLAELFAHRPATMGPLGRDFFAEHAALNVAVARRITLGKACGVGVLLCAGAELREYYHELKEDLEDETEAARRGPSAEHHH
jgi:hypothetical protein